ncbi:MAG: hypothetical protein ACTSQB_05740, partial [Candidatus Heimdallarchaeota archaeon]
DQFKDKDWGAIGSTIVIVVLLVSFGILVRLLFAYYYRVKFPVNNIIDVWERSVQFSPGGVVFAGYGDFPYYYDSWVNAWFNDGWYPFTDWRLTIEGDPLYYYSYPPIFLYFLLLIWRPGMSNLWIAFPMIVADAACAAVVFLIIRKIIKGKQSTLLAFIGGFVMVLSPINIIYDGVYWLNPGPVTLFTLISFYFVVDRKWRKAFFWLAIATMTKQNALFLTYPLFMVMLGEKVKDKGIKRASFESIMIAVFYVAVCGVVSVPWIFITPIFYGVHFLYPGQRLTLSSFIKEPLSNNTISFTWSLKQAGMNGAFLDIIAFCLNSMLLLILSASLIVVPMLYRSYKGKIDNVEFFEWISIYVIISHIFMPRGVYKFYSAYYMPILLIAIIGTLGYYGKRTITKSTSLILATGLFFGFSFWHLVILREFTPLILLLACVVIGVLAAARGTMKLLDRKYHLGFKTRGFIS